MTDSTLDGGGILKINHYFDSREWKNSGFGQKKTWRGQWGRVMTAARWGQSWNGIQGSDEARGEIKGCYETT